MQKRLILFPQLSLLVLLLLSFGTAENKPMPPTGKCLIELFTSEGCSSCPPAEELVAKVSKEYGDHIQILCYHVDYWDRLGWKDFYSSPEYSLRQKKYSEAFQLNGFYTPQAIVNGRSEFVASDSPKLYSAIESELKLASVAAIEIIPHIKNKSQIEIRYKVSNAENNLFNIALIQKSATTAVKKGENEGKILSHINIVRKLIAVNMQKESNGMITIDIPTDIKVQDCKIIAFTQSSKNMHITGSIESGIE